MPTDKPIAYLELLKRLKKFNIEITERGNKCFLFHPNINGKPEYYTLHNQGLKEVTIKQALGEYERESRVRKAPNTHATNMLQSEKHFGKCLY